MATKVKVLSISCLNVNMAGGYQLAKDLNTFLTSQVTWYMGKTGLRFQKNLNSLFILGSSPISNNCERKNDSALLTTFKYET